MIFTDWLISFIAFFIGSCLIAWVAYRAGGDTARRQTRRELQRLRRDNTDLAVHVEELYAETRVLRTVIEDRTRPWLRAGKAARA